SRLEEMLYSKDGVLNGSYSYKASLTHNLDSSLEIGLRVSATPFFKADFRLKNRCKSQTEILFELTVYFS
ncbi:MAG: hypothetical protein ACRCZZ_01460, partial [Phocaeicola sp.]